MPEVLMPRLSDSMESGTILRWLAADGATVARGDELAEIETDKATMTYEADDEGVLAILVAEGETVDVGVPIATLGAGAPASAPDASSPAATAPAASAPASAGSAPAAPTSPSPAAAPRPDVPAPASVAARNGHVADGGSAPSATPLARRVASAIGVDLRGIAGTGPRGRITRADVTAAGGAAAGAVELPPIGVPAAPTRAVAAPTPAPSSHAAPAAPAAPPAADTAKGATTVVELSRLQQTIARRMSEAKATVPEFSVQTEVDMTEAVAYRARLKELVERAPSLNDLVVQACARALRTHPRVNGSFRDGRFELHERINVGIAVAAADALVVPVIRDADRRSLGEIGAEARRLAAAVRDGSITPPDLSGATFTVSNLGMFGMTAIAPVINLPNAAILGVGAVVDRPVAWAGELAIRPQLTLTLTCDHRILYGADAARFLADVRTLLETPERIALSA